MANQDVAGMDEASRPDGLAAIFNSIRRTARHRQLREQRRTVRVICPCFGTEEADERLPAALAELGFAVCTLLQHDWAPLAADAADREPELRRRNWPSVLSKYQAVAGWPAFLYFDELLEAFPDALVVLSLPRTGDMGDWHRATSERQYALWRLFDRWPLLRVAAWLLPAPVLAVRPSLALLGRLWRQPFDGRFAEPAFAADAYKRALAQVMHRRPPGSLFLYSTAQTGARSLAEFLGVGALSSRAPRPPDSPWRHVDRLRRLAWLLHTVAALCVLSALWAIITRWSLV